MARQQEPLYKRDGIFYLRWHEGKKRKRLSLGTSDPTEAVRRMPIVRETGLSWDDYQRKLQTFDPTPQATIRGISRSENAGTSFNPPESSFVPKNAVVAFLETMVQSGRAQYDPEKEVWKFYTVPQNMPVVEGLQKINNALLMTDDTKSIEQFYNHAVLQLYTDKKTNKRFGDIWLEFLKKQDITSWRQITETLVSEFKQWRFQTPMARNNQTDTSPPQTITVNRHIRYLSKSFDLAVSKKFMDMNPIKFWKPDPAQSKIKEGLTKEELFEVLAYEKWQQDYLINGHGSVQMQRQRS